MVLRKALVSEHESPVLVTFRSPRNRRLRTAQSDPRFNMMTYLHHRRLRLALETAISEATDLKDRFLAYLLSMAYLELDAVELRSQDQSSRVDAEEPERDFAPNFLPPKVVGSWNWDVKRDRVRADPEVAKLFQVDPSAAAAGTPIAAFAQAVHPEDVPRLQAAIQHSLTSGESLCLAYRVLRSSGGSRCVLAIGRAVLDNGIATSFPGTLVDVEDDISASRH
jgi:PAS domain-containing protein